MRKKREKLQTSQEEEEEEVEEEEEAYNLPSENAPNDLDRMKEESEVDGEDSDGWEYEDDEQAASEANSSLDLSHEELRVDDDEDDESDDNVGDPEFKADHKDRIAVGEPNSVTGSEAQNEVQISEERVGIRSRTDNESPEMKVAPSISSDRAVRGEIIQESRNKGDDPASAEELEEEGEEESEYSYYESSDQEEDEEKDCDIDSDGGEVIAGEKEHAASSQQSLSDQERTIEVKPPTKSACGDSVESNPEPGEKSDGEVEAVSDEPDLEAQNFNGGGEEDPATSSETASSSIKKEEEGEESKRDFSSNPADWISWVEGELRRKRELKLERQRQRQEEEGRIRKTELEEGEKEDLKSEERQEEKDEIIALGQKKDEEKNLEGGVDDKTSTLNVDDSGNPTKAELSENKVAEDDSEYSYYEDEEEEDGGCREKVEAVAELEVHVGNAENGKAEDDVKDDGVVQEVEGGAVSGGQQQDAGFQTVQRKCRDDLDETETAATAAESGQSPVEEVESDILRQNDPTQEEEEEEEEEDDYEWEEYSWEEYDEEEDEEEEEEDGEENKDANGLKESESPDRGENGKAALQRFPTEGNGEDSGYDASRSSPGSSVLGKLGRPRQQQQHITVGDQDHLDDMLARVKKLREERKQILSDMNMLKSAFDDSGNGDSCVTSPEAIPGEEGFQFPTTRPKSKKVKDVEKDDDGAIICVICGSRLGRRLNVGAVMHLGLEDGDPICPKALFLTAESRGKLRNIALTKNLEPERKLEMLEMVHLELQMEDEDADGGGGGSGDDEDASSRLGIERFLDEMEQRRDRDRQESAAIKAGLLLRPEMEGEDVDDDDYDEGVEAATEMEVTINVDDDDDDEETESAELEEEYLKAEHRLHGRYDDPQSCYDIDADACGEERPLRSDLVPEEYGLEGQPRLSLLRQISSSPTKLKHVNTRDRSAPYIPEDTEIYFYAGEAANARGNRGRVPDASSIASKRYPFNPRAREKSTRFG